MDIIQSLFKLLETKLDDCFECKIAASNQINITCNSRYIGVLLITYEGDLEWITAYGGKHYAITNPTFDPYVMIDEFIKAIGYATSKLMFVVLHY